MARRVSRRARRVGVLPARVDYGQLPVKGSVSGIGSSVGVLCLRCLAAADDLYGMAVRIGHPRGAECGAEEVVRR
jgi:hypothetical protein